MQVEDKFWVNESMSPFDLEHDCHNTASFSCRLNTFWQPVAIDLKVKVNPLVFRWDGVTITQFFELHIVLIAANMLLLMYLNHVS